MSNTKVMAVRRNRAGAKPMTLSLDEEVQAFLDARDGLRIDDALYGDTSDGLLPRQLDAINTKRP